MLLVMVVVAVRFSCVVTSAVAGVVLRLLLVGCSHSHTFSSPGPGGPQRTNCERSGYIEIIQSFLACYWKRKTRTGGNIERTTDMTTMECVCQVILLKICWYVAGVRCSMLSSGWANMYLFFNRFRNLKRFSSFSVQFQHTEQRRITIAELVIKKAQTNEKAKLIWFQH